jgi:hypothetical protein
MKSATPKAAAAKAATPKAATAKAATAKAHLVDKRVGMIRSDRRNQTFELRCVESRLIWSL